MSRRCTQRQFLLRPCPLVAQVFEYCLAEAAARFDIILIGWLVMSNHYHLSAHDQHGNFPAFLAHLNKMVAKALNAYWGRSENLFAAEQVNIVRCESVEDALAKLVYLLANPVSDHLVDRAVEWPGASSITLLDGGDRIIERPDVFFRKNGRMPETAVLRAEPPPEWKGSQADWATLVRRGISQVEHAAREERTREHRGVVGVHSLLHLSENDKPATRAPRGGLRPFIACRDPDRRVTALRALREFRQAYRRARDALAAGAMGVVFPTGTYLMARLGVAGASPSTAPT